MKTLSLFAVTIAAAAMFALAAPRESSADTPCVTKEFKTTLTKDACTKGGQPEAVIVMKKYLSNAKARVAEIKDCKSCHTTLLPDYKLTPNALELFRRSGGK